MLYDPFEPWPLDRIPGPQLLPALLLHLLVYGYFPTLRTSDGLFIEPKPPNWIDPNHPGLVN